MKVIFEFDTDSENFNNCELEQVKQADKMARTLSEITDQLRSWYKYDTRGSIPIDEIHEKIWEIIKENNINIDEIWG